MKKLIAFLLIVCVIIGCCCAASTTVIESSSQNNFFVLIYHDVPKGVYLDDYAVDRTSFIQQIEYLRTHGYNFISVEDLIKTNNGEKGLPEKAILLRSDDAYLSFYEFVYPILELYGYPCLLAVVPNWIDSYPSDYLKAPLMNWEQLKEVSKSGLVEIASHSQNLHGDIVYNLQGNTCWAAVSREYNPETGAYETAEEYRKRIHDDLLLSRNILRDKLGVEVRAIVWPYGRYNQICIEEAKKAGLEIMFQVEDKWARADNLDAVPGSFVMQNPTIEVFIKSLKSNFDTPIQHRIIQADLDLLYDSDPIKQQKNIDKFIERVFTMKPSAVYLQAFCDEQGDGAISSVYFPNRVLPMRSDLFSYVANQLSIRNIPVYAWMPMLSIVLPNKEENESLRVRESRNGEKNVSSSWYPRLSPFSPEARQKLVMLYEDLAASNPRIDGIIFQDDGYLNDFEDFHPDACKEYIKISGNENIPYQELDKEQKQTWTKLKTKTLIGLTEELKEAVLYYNPHALFARTLYASVLREPESEEWFAQNYADSLKAYDYVVIMAYPRMEKVSQPIKWLKNLVKEAEKYPDGIQKTVFKIQTYDWDKEQWINTKTLDQWLRALVSSGAQHIGYYPDNCIDNKPDEKIIRLMMSKEDFPFKRQGEK